MDSEDSTIHVGERHSSAMPEQSTQPLVSYPQPEDTAPLLEHHSPRRQLHQSQAIDYPLMATDKIQAQNWLEEDKERPLDSSEQLPPVSRPRLDVDDLSTTSTHQILHYDVSNPDNIDLTNSQGAVDSNPLSSSESNYRGTGTLPNAPPFFDVGNLAYATPACILPLSQVDPSLHGFSPGGQFDMTDDLQNWFEQFDTRIHIPSDCVSAQRNGTPTVSETTSQHPLIQNSSLHTRTDYIRSADFAVPTERFRKVEQCWPHRSGHKTRAMHNLWREISVEMADNLFTDLDGLAKLISQNKLGSFRRGLDQEARVRLEKVLHRVHGSPNANGTTPTTTIWLPPAEIFDMGLDLYFRHFHPLLPFVHVPTFDPRSTDVSVLFIMCLIGIALINTNGAVSFVQQAFDVRFTFHQFVYFAVPACSL
jgi:hypothetical protein